MEELELDNKPILRLAFPEETDNKLSPPNDEEILFKIGNVKLEEEENSKNKKEIIEIKIKEVPEEKIEKESDKIIIEEKKPKEEELEIEENKKDKEEIKEENKRRK